MPTMTSRTKCVLLTLFGYTALPTLAAFAQTQDIDDEIIVTGSLLSATTGETLVGISVLTGEELQRRMSGSLGETLKFEPGISSSFFGTGASRPIIRGQGGLRVLLLDNGIGSIDASAASPDHAGAVEPAMASRIEVIRGSSLLRYGSAASGGVINVIDGRIPDTVPTKSIVGNARIGVSSVDNGTETALGSDVHLGKIGSGDIVAHVAFAHRNTGNYDIPDFARSEILRQIEVIPAPEEIRGSLPNSATKASTLAGGLSYIDQNAFFGAAIKDLNSEYGLPGGEGATIELNQTRVDFASKFAFGDSVLESLNTSGGVANYLHTEIEPSGEVGTVFTNKGFEVRTELLQKEIGAWRGAHGLQYKKREFSAIGEEAFVPPTITNSIGAFSFQELELGELHLEAAVRYEQVKHTNDTGVSLEFNGFSGSVGVDYHLTDTIRLGGSLYRTKRAPTTEELFSNGPHLATNQFEIGDIGLGMEIATGAEFSLRYKSGGNHLTINVFQTNYTDYIFQELTGVSVITDEGDTLFISRFSPSNVVFKGFEVDVVRNLVEWNDWGIAADASLEYVTARHQVGTNEPLPRIPPLGITLGVSADADRWKLRTELEYAAKKTNISLRELPSDGFVLINTYASYKVNNNMTVRLSANNLTDQDARQHTSYLKEVVPLPGRNFSASLAVSF